MKRPKSEQKVKVIALHLTKKEHKEFGSRAKDAGYKSLTSYAASLCGLAVARPPKPPEPQGQEAAPEPQFEVDSDAVARKDAVEVARFNPQ